MHGTMESYATEQMEVRLAPPCAALLRLALHPNPDPDPSPNPNPNPNPNPHPNTLTRCSARRRSVR